MRTLPALQILSSVGLLELQLQTWEHMNIKKDYQERTATHNHAKSVTMALLLCPSALVTGILQASKAASNTLELGCHRERCLSRLFSRRVQTTTQAKELEVSGSTILSAHLHLPWFPLFHLSGLCKLVLTACISDWWLIFKNDLDASEIKSHWQQMSSALLNDQSPDF